MVGIAGRVGEFDLCVVATANRAVLPETRWNMLGRRHGERFEEQSFDRCDAAPQIFANYELDVFIELHMDDLQGTGPRPALDLVQANISQKIRSKMWTVNEVGMRYRRVKRERVLHNDVAQHGPGDLQTSTNAEGGWILLTEA